MLKKFYKKKRSPLLKNHGRMHHKFNPNYMPNQQLFKIPQVPNPISPFLYQNYLIFGGTVSQLLTKFNQLTQQDKYDIKTAKLSIKGNIKQQRNKFCFYLTFIIGILLIIPLLFFKLRSFRKKYDQVCQLTLSQYEAIMKMLKECPNVKKIQIFVLDNYIDKRKCQLIQQTILYLRVKHFQFNNFAYPINLCQNQEKCFEEEFQQIKQRQDISFTITWGNYKWERNVKQQLIIFQDIDNKMIQDSDTEE